MSLQDSSDILPKKYMKKLNQHPHLQKLVNQMMAQSGSGSSPEETVVSNRDKLRQKIREKRGDRISVTAQKQIDEKTKKRTEIEKEKLEKDKTQLNEEISKYSNQVKNKKKRYNKKMKALQSHYNTTISINQYLECLTLQNENNFKNDSERNHNQNLIQLYEYQQKKLLCENNDNELKMEDEDEDEDADGSEDKSEDESEDESED